MFFGLRWWVDFGFVCFVEDGVASGFLVDFWLFQALLLCGQGRIFVFGHWF